MKITPLATLPRTRIAIAAALLSLYWIVLPVRSLPLEAGVSTADCQTAADRDDREITVAELEQCSILLPADAELMADLGAAYEDAGRLEDAESAYRRALRVDPDFADVRRSLAVLLERRGANDAARQEIEAALRVQPNRHALEAVEQPHP